MTRSLVSTFLLVSLALTFVPVWDAQADCEAGGSPIAIDTARRGDSDGRGGTGAGGTGFGESDGTGTGGTGLGGDEEPGTGTGGTGILGIVTGFGSVCVNGHEIEYDESTRIEIDGEPGATTDLAVGQLVRITTSAQQPTHAREIGVQNILIGRVDRVSKAERSVWVLGHPVRLRESGAPRADDALRDAGGAPLEPGTRVAVSGFRRSDGVVAATRIAVRSNEGPHQATEVVRRAEDDALVVGGVRVTVAPEERLASESFVGRRVRVRGEWNAKTSTLERARIQPADSLDASIHRVSIQGTVSAGRGERGFQVGDVYVDSTGIDLDLERLPVDSRVRVEGFVERRGRVRADRVVIEERAHRDLQGDLSGNGVRDRRGRGDRSDRDDRSDREDRSGRGDRSARPERADRPERSERPERSGRSSR